MNIFILHHLGLGDQIMLNGMVRHFLEEHNVKLLCKYTHKSSVEFMYKDVPKNKLSFEFVETTDSATIWNIAKKHNEKENYKVLALATYGVSDDAWRFFTNLNGTDFTNWAHGVYIQAGINPMYMYTKFKVDRDPLREQDLFDKYELANKRYIFIHDDKDRNQLNTRHRTDLEIFRPHSQLIDSKGVFFKCDDSNIFDFIKILESAEEVHCMNSSYNWMIELMKINDKSKNYFHTWLAHPYIPVRSVKTVFTQEMWTFVD